MPKPSTAALLLGLLLALPLSAAAQPRTASTLALELAAGAAPAASARAGASATPPACAAPTGDRPGAVGAYGEPTAIEVRVDPRVELLSVIFRMAGTPGYTMDRFERYVDDIEAHFGPHRDHPAVQAARRLMGERGVAWDAPMELAVHLTEPPALAPRMSFEALTFEALALDSRWTPDEAQAFVEHAQAFAQDTDFDRFFREHRALYDTAEARMQAFLARHVDAVWFEEFFGARPEARFAVLIGLSNGGASYSVRFTSPEHPEEFYAVMGTWLTDDEGLPLYDESVTGTVVHEFAHAFVNPLVDAHADALRPSGEALLDAVRDPMTQQGYGAWPIVVEESLVRAAVARYALAHGGAEAGTREVAHQLDRSFVWADELYAVLGVYERARDRYGTFEAFAPDLVAYFEDLAPRVSEKVAQDRARRPHVVGTTPANGAVGVDPALTQLTVHFDRRMDPQWHPLVTRGSDGQDHYPGSGDPSFDSTATALTLPVALKPNWTYRFALGSEGGAVFRSRDGVAMPVVWVEFTTGSD